MVSQTEQKEIKLEIGLPQGGFPKTMYFNRFRVDRDAGFCLVQFGLLVASDLVDSYSCVLPQETLQQNQNTLVDYLNRLGRPTESEPTPWKGVTTNRQVDVADVMTMAFRGKIAEICFFVYSLSAATRMKKGTVAAMNAQPLVLLRCPPELQREIIVALYEE